MLKHGNLNDNCDFSEYVVQDKIGVYCSLYEKRTKKMWAENK